MTALNATDEKGLLEKIKKGDVKAFEQLYLRYDKQLFYNILKLVRINEIAAEIHQDVFLKLWTNRSRIDPDRPVTAFLKQIARNMAIDFYRKASRDSSLREQIALTMTEYHDPVNEHILLKETNEALEVAINKLPTQRQKVFRLIKLENKTYEYAAEHFGVSIGTIKDHMAKASRFLKSELLTPEGKIASFVLIIAASQL
ncbi:RNA polymerase sigma factor [Pedobacter borealis]|uniref:RNA polymerase sigma factor n=1 Tax=Pedobacter borealis TaxID=475254 RepID=UPI0006907CC9|nr:sigma-70 family RNA polymerase sigma factor [Pedobacter borealis]